MVAWISGPGRRHVAAIGARIAGLGALAFVGGVFLGQSLLWFGLAVLLLGVAISIWALFHKTISGLPGRRGVVPVSDECAFEDHEKCSTIAGGGPECLCECHVPAWRPYVSDPVVAAGTTQDRPETRWAYTFNCEMRRTEMLASFNEFGSSSWVDDKGILRTHTPDGISIQVYWFVDASRADNFLADLEIGLDSRTSQPEAGENFKRLLAKVNATNIQPLRRNEDARQE